MKHYHKATEIDPGLFKDRVPTENGTGTTEYIFDEADVLRFLIDALNDAKVNAAMINHDHENAIEYRGRREYFSMGIASLSTPECAVIEGMEELSYILNTFEDIESWTSYRNKKHFLHILRLPDVQTAIKEVPEGEDNIEASE